MQYFTHRSSRVIFSGVLIGTGLLVSMPVAAQSPIEPCRGQGGTITEQTTHAMGVLLVTRVDTPCRQVLNGIFSQGLRNRPRMERWCSKASD